MSMRVYIPPSSKTAEKHLALAAGRGITSLTNVEFVRAWCSLAYLYPGLHPEGFQSSDSGWPETLKPLASEAWRRAEVGELTDNQLFCYQATKARLMREYQKGASEGRLSKWYVPDHFAT